MSLTGVATGDTLIVFLTSTAGGGESFSVSDGVNTYTSAVGITSGPPNNQVGEIFVAKNVTGGNLTLTVTTTLSTSHFGAWVEASGVSTVTPVQGTDSDGIQTGSAVSQNVGNVVDTTAANSYALQITSAFGSGAVPITQTVGSSWTLRQDIAYSAGSSRASGYVADQQIATSGTGVQASSELSRTGSWLELMVILNPVLTSSISGSVGISGATVSYTGTSSGSMTSGGGGAYTIPGLSNGSYTITPTLAYYTFSPTSRMETVSGSNITGVNFTPTADTWSISGNAGVGGATVSYTGTSSGSVVADGSGAYSITGLANGSYTLTPSLTDYVFTPTSQAETVLDANITGVNFTVTAPTVYVAEVQVVVTYQNPGNYLYARDLNSWGDGGTYEANNGSPYPSTFVTIGNITLTPPGALMMPLQHVVGYFDAVGTLNYGGPSVPNIWILPNELSESTEVQFVRLPEVLPEPPMGQNTPSQTMLALRWPVNMANSQQISQFVHHLQCRVVFEPECAPSTIKALAFKENQD